MCKDNKYFGFFFTVKKYNRLFLYVYNIIYIYIYSVCRHSNCKINTYANVDCNITI